MGEVRQLVQVIQVKYYCEETQGCDGHMAFISQGPDGFVHQCVKCGRRATLKVQYPSLVYEEYAPVFHSPRVGVGQTEESEEEAIRHSLEEGTTQEIEEMGAEGASAEPAE